MTHSIILLGSVYRSNYKSYYPHTFLEECKYYYSYEVKKKTAKRFMTKDLTDPCFYSEPKSKDKSLVDKL